METECRYDQPSRRPAAAVTGPGTGDTHEANAALERRLLAVEQRLHVLDPVNGSPDVNSATVNEQPKGLGGRKTTPVQDDGVDGMGAVPLKDGAEEDEYFGMSSNVAFLRFIVDSVGRPVNSVLGPSSSESAHFENESICGYFARPTSFTGYESQRGSPKRPVALPQREETDSLLRLYFSTVNLMIPGVHEDSFRTTYAKMQRNGLSGIRKSWLGVLNVILAIATNVLAATSPTREQATKSKMYFEQALELIKADMLGRLSLEMVQLFLLMEAYLEGTTSSSMTWTFHGLAVKGSYQLGLHIMGSRNVSHIDQEVRRRLWYWCVMNDRLLSVRYGRPPLIPLSHVRLEPSLHLPFSNVPSATTASSLAFFDAIMNITHIMGEALDQLYGQNLGFSTSPQTSEVLDHISRLCWKLAQWQDNIPLDLRIIDPDKETLDDVPLTAGTTRLRVLLSLRYLGTRVLILRPVLGQFLALRQGVAASNKHQAEWLWSSGVTFLADLVQTCCKVFQISKSILIGSRNDQNLLGAWWFSCYYTFNAALAVLGVLLVKRIPTPTPTESGEPLSALSTAELRVLLDTAMEVLTGLDQGSRTLMRCRNTLGRLLAAIHLDGNTEAFTQESLSLSPSSAWTWDLMDPGLFSSEASLGLAMGASAIGYGSQMPDGMQNATETWDLARSYDSVA
ncbi:fungal specific transcription factor domain-containing protein [Aspergillus puulaauensis]|uniref:Xylanolytic transcriptional activator regulatory domain-containing protein n=1 Tax=Aspergillus puulaauensis TaxID=1220207 RepID=A0A7R8AHV0_9EURO|nr:uncharacterized protein APUU_12279A [Aspergillus puulaauensis]BCS19451.1 hypothetical protein APUU_12279A [Aspergillus puulaauensis]